MVILIQLISKYSTLIYAICGVCLLYTLRVIFLAMRERNSSIFTLEKEKASERVYYALMAIVVLLAISGGVLYVDTFITPNIQIPERAAGVTPTVGLIPTPTYTPAPPTPTLPPTATRARPTRVITTDTPTPPPSPVATATTVFAACPNPQARITYPNPNQTISGKVEVKGGAFINNFWFYKLEYGYGEQPNVWNSVGEDVRRVPVTDGTLEIWDTDQITEGVYNLRLTVVDETGNYPPENTCVIRVIIQR